VPIGGIIGGLVGGIGSIIGGSNQADAIKSAANTQAQAAAQATQLQRDIFNQTSANMLPFLQLGTTAANRLASYYGVNPDGSVNDTPFLEPISQQIGGPPSPLDQSLTNTIGNVTGMPFGVPPPAAADPNRLALTNTTLGGPPSPFDPSIAQANGGFGLAGPPTIEDPALLALTGTTLGPPPSPSDPNLRSQFTQSPGYQYQLEQMKDAVTNSAVGRQGISGNLAQALQQNAAGLANQDWWNFYNQDVNSWSQAKNNLFNVFNANANRWATGTQNYWNIYNNLLNNWGQAKNNYWNLYNADVNRYTLGANANNNIYNQLLGNYTQRYQDIANQRNTISQVLGNIGQSGQNAAGNLGTFGQNFATQAGNNAILGGSALAAGKIGAQNAFTGGVNNAINNLFGSGTIPMGGSGGTSNPFSGIGNSINNLFGGNNGALSGLLASITGGDSFLNPNYLGTGPVFAGDVGGANFGGGSY
jgi:hypothetical protein